MSFYVLFKSTTSLKIKENVLLSSHSIKMLRLQQVSAIQTKLHCRISFINTNPSFLFGSKNTRGRLKSEIPTSLDFSESNYNRNDQKPSESMDYILKCKNM